MNNKIKIENLHFRYKNFDFDFFASNLEILKSRFTCIIGPNGSGKSTFFKICSGQEKNYRGTIELCGKNILDYKKTELAKKIAYLPQDVEKTNNYLVEDVVMMGRYPHQGRFLFPNETDRQIVYESLKKVGSQDFLKREFSLLSGGERKRVLIASVLAQESEFLLLDEPGASLDISNQARIFSLLKKIKENNKGVVVATHNINLASIFADFIILFQNGRILKSGLPHEVITKENLNLVYGDYIEIIEHPKSGRQIVLPKIKDDFYA